MLRVGFFGAGGISRVHAATLRLQPDAEVVAVSTRSAARAAGFSNEYAQGAAAWYPDPMEMLRNAALDVLFVAVPPGAHAGEVEEAARLGTHLLLEKPIALSLERAESIRAAVSEAGVVCQVGFQLRHSDPVLRLKETIDSGAAGRPLFLTGRFVTDSLYSAWWRDPELGGGQLVEQAIHLYDLARHCLGEPLTVAALLDNLNHTDVPDYKVDDVSAAIARFSTGAIASISSSNCGAPDEGGLQASLQFEHVLAEIHGSGEGHVTLRSERTTSHDLGDPSNPRSAYEEQTADLFAAIRTGSATRSTVDDGVEALRFVLAARRSAAQGGEVVRMR